VTNDFHCAAERLVAGFCHTMVELTKVYNELASTYFDYIGLGLLAASIYFVMGLPIARLSRYMEAKLAYMKA
jgi:ABC-type amino acid transport system permease subunit